MKKFFILIILILLIVGLRITFIFANGEHPKSQFKEETDPKAFKIISTLQRPMKIGYTHSSGAQ